MKNRASRKNENNAKPAAEDGSLAADSLDDQKSSREQENGAHKEASCTF